MTMKKSPQKSKFPRALNLSRTTRLTKMAFFSLHTHGLGVLHREDLDELGIKWMKIFLDTPNISIATPIPHKVNIRDIPALSLRNGSIHLEILLTDDNNKMSFAHFISCWNMKYKNNRATWDYAIDLMQTLHPDADHLEESRGHLPAMPWHTCVSTPESLSFPWDDNVGYIAEAVSNTARLMIMAATDRYPH